MNSDTPKKGSIYRKIALWCWLLPMIAGVSVFMAYLLCLFRVVSVRSQFLIAFAGEITIAAGVLLSVAGIICLWIYKRQNRLQWRYRAVLNVLALLVSNYFLAALFILIAAKTWVHTSSPYSVEVSNLCSSADIKTLSFRDPQGNIHPFESVARGEVIKHFYHFKGEGEVRYTFTKRWEGQQSDMPEQRGTVFGYISLPMEGHRFATMQFHDSCTGNCLRDCIVTVTEEN